MCVILHIIRRSFIFVVDDISYPEDTMQRRHNMESNFRNSTNHVYETDINDIIPWFFNYYEFSVVFHQEL